MKSKDVAYCGELLACSRYCSAFMVCTTDCCSIRQLLRLALSTLSVTQWSISTKWHSSAPLDSASKPMDPVPAVKGRSV